MSKLSIPKPLLVLCPLLLLVSVVMAADTGSLAGRVILDNAQPLGGAQVVFYKIRKGRSDALGRIIPLEPLYSGTVTTASDGTFLAEGIPSGSYIICASGTEPYHLRSCDWGGGRTDIEAGAASVASPLTLNIRTGALLTIGISDPSGKIVLQDAQGLTRSQTNVAIGVISKLGYYRANLTGHSGDTWSYSVAVPIGVPVSLFLDTKLSITGGNLAPAATGALPGNLKLPVTQMISSPITVAGTGAFVTLAVQ